MRNAVDLDRSPRPRDEQPRRRTATAQPRPDIADQLERLTPRLDELTQRARLGITSARDYDALEELAQKLARDLVAPFRGRRAVNPPLFVSADGRSAGW